MSTLNFKDLLLSTEVRKAIEDMGFEEATPIQAQSIPHLLEGRDLIGQAQTGTGKTCAFGIPAIESVDPDAEDVQVLVLCPTRELAIQSSEELKSVAKYKKGLKILPIYGGQPIDRQIYALKKRPQIIIGTPGRVMDHMRRNTLKLKNLQMIILDEADEMLNMGFREDIDTILEKVPDERQTIFFSATMAKEIMELTAKYQKDPLHIKVAHKELTVPSIEQYYLEVGNTARPEILSRLIDTQNIKLALVFCNTKKRVDELTGTLQTRGYAAEALHGDMRQEQRDKVMARFRKGHIDILIATDVAARGIDVDDVEAVFNYDIPNDDEYYVHRIGRTGRAGRTGKAFTFVSGREMYKIKDIQKYTKASIHLMKPPTLMDVEEYKMNALLDKLQNTISEGKFTRYVSYVEQSLEMINSQGEDDHYVTSLEIAAALLMMVSEANRGESASAPVEDKEESTAREKGMVRLFINVGKEQKIQPKHIVESIASSTSLSGKLIGAIDIYDRYTFVEVPSEFADEVMESMKNHTVRGKRINIEKSNAKRKLKRRA